MSDVRERIEEARSVVMKNCTSRPAKAMEPEDEVNGRQVWHVRQGRKKVLTSLPLPNELDDVDDVTACAEIAERVAADHSNLDRTMSLFASIGLGALVIIGANVFVGSIADLFEGGISSQVSASVQAVAVLCLVLFVVRQVARDSDPPEVWERRAQAYRRRLADLQPPPTVVLPCTHPEQTATIRRGWWRRRR